jgi:hypothetical protein
MRIWTNKAIRPLKSVAWHAATLELPAAATGARLVAAGLAGWLWWSGWPGVLGASDGKRGFESHRGGGLRVDEDGLDCTDRLGSERPSLLAPSKGLVSTGFNEGFAKSRRTEPIANGVAVDAD